MKRTAILEKGREVLDAGQASIQAVQSDQDDAVDVIERYVELFSVWQAQCESALGPEASGDQAQGPTGLATAQREEETRSPEAVLFQAIADQHAELFRMVGELREEMSEALRALHERGRGMKAYADNLPKRISTIRSRKG